MSDELETPKKRLKRGEQSKIQAEQEQELPHRMATQPEFYASLGLRAVGSLPPPKPPKPPMVPVQLLNARGMPARIRKRNRLFFDDHIINDNKSLRVSLSPKKPPNNLNSSPIRSPSKSNKKRKLKPMRMTLLPKPTSSVEDTSYSSPSKIASPKNQTTAIHTTPKSKKKSLKKTSKILHFDSMQTAAEKRAAGVGQNIGMQLRNLLKLPKAHKWVIYEWFYSFIDKPIFEGANEFELCQSDLFPGLQTRSLIRKEWAYIRSKMGKPRRCSSAFFKEERRELERKRQRIRYMQTRKTGECKNVSILRNLPNKIPHFLPVGTKVTARLREPQDGIFSGQVAAVDSATSIYRITFDRPGLGTHSVPDFEISSDSFDEMLPLNSITKDFRPNLMNVLNGANPFSLQFAGEPLSRQNNNANSNTGGCSSSHSITVRNVRSLLPNNSNINKSDPLLGQEIEDPYQDVVERESLNGYPIKFLETLRRLQTAVKMKHEKLDRLNEMNNQAEVKCSQQLTRRVVDEFTVFSDTSMLGIDFQRRYASLVVQLEKLNKDMQEYLSEIQMYNNDLSRDPQVLAMLMPSYLREKCREAAEDALKRNNQQATLQNKQILGLIKKLATVMMVASHLGNENTTQVAKVLEGCMEEVRSNIEPANVETFKRNVQLHLHHIRLGIGQNMMTANANASLNNSTAASD